MRNQLKLIYLIEIQYLQRIHKRLQVPVRINNIINLIIGKYKYLARFFNFARANTFKAYERPIKVINIFLILFGASNNHFYNCAFITVVIAQCALGEKLCTVRNIAV